ncbi:ubiquitin carboxyl-terminal hydrolase 30 homolog [Neocloeon triangulifer]|uniref:ubiquitin carboxyl-terminal hydrolase 30 homolog n=1 Tax=Neocloeon triangulifer TaxID=2078957 RepID=UPI00286F283D|nr:ubiquitin carboxyl-terminal hydrolase 30 homolog [Neocloeon triangulifer]
MSYFPLNNFKFRWSTIQSILRMPTAINLADLTQERTLFVAGILVFSLMGSFVLWGPAPKRLKGSKKSKAVKGLANMGETCFLNTLLQALAACPLFCHWLEQHKDSRLASALHEIITFVNGYGAESDTPLFPRAVVSALSAHGWSMGLGQQDSHELFFILMTSLEEQAAPPAKSADILALLDKVEESSSDYESLPPAIKEDDNQNEKHESPINNCPDLKRPCYISRAGKQLKTTPSHKFDFPFRGQQLSQLTCTVCSKSSVVQHQAFDCLSLTLPAKGFMSCSLDQLLSNFTAPEQVSGVLCEHCSKGGGSPTKTSFVKQLSIGRLPKCLCIHIQRTSWMPNGQAYKRMDFVSFPEVLVMDKYTYFHKERLKRTLLKQLVPRPTELNLTPSAAGASTKNSPAEATSQIKDIVEARHKYLLQAVVVHIGEVSSGHFVTFRRVPQPSKCQEEWVCTSDDQCQNSCLAEVLKAEAYMLFYEKIGSGPSLSSSQG